MNVEVRIGTLLLNGVELRQRERAALPFAVQEALAELLTSSGAGRARPPRTDTSVEVYPRTPRVEAIAGQIATAVHSNLPARTARPARQGGRR